MTRDEDGITTHPAGEAGEQDLQTVEGVSAVDTFGGKLFVRWDPDGLNQTTS
jgi:hypothetical protein